MKVDSVCSSVEDVEAIVRKVLADVLAKQPSGSGTLSLNIEDFELPDDVGSMFTTITLPNEIKDDVGKGGGLVSGDRSRVSPTFLLTTSHP